MPLQENDPSSPAFSEESVSSGTLTDMQLDDSSEQTTSGSEDEDEQSQISNVDWIDGDYVSVNTELFNGSGIVAVKPVHVDATALVTDNTFVFGSRTLLFADESVLTERGILVPATTRKLLKQLQEFADDSNMPYQMRLAAIEILLKPILEPRSGLGDLEPKKSQKRKPQSIIGLIKEYAEETNSVVVCKSPDERDNFVEEVFLPFVINRQVEEKAELPQFGLKLYPWFSRDANNAGKKFKHEGFKIFAVELCMFGAAMKGRDGNNNLLSLIKHDIKFFPGQKIISIECMEPCFYETAQLAIFENLVHMISQLSHPREPKKLYCHLPYYDYMLFGIELFIQNRINEKALSQFFNKIFQKKSAFSKRLIEICRTQDIQITIESPFDNVFGGLTLKKGDSISKNILRILELEDYTKEELTEEQILQKQASVVQRCLTLVVENEYNTLHRQVWKDFIQKAGDITTLKELFKIANAVMIGAASYKKKDDEVCSLMPLSGKQIQRGYTKYSGVDPRYPRIINLTFVDPVIGYSQERDVHNKDQGLLFYVDDSRGAANKVIHGLFRQASHNASTSPESSIYQRLDSKLLRSRRMS
jgi:hypothetical protein